MSSPGYRVALFVLLLAVTTHLQAPCCAAARVFPAGPNSTAKPQAPLPVGTTAAPAGISGNGTTTRVLAVHGRTTVGGGEGQYTDLKGECATRGGCNVPGAPFQTHPPVPKIPLPGGPSRGVGIIGCVIGFLRKKPCRPPK